MEINSDEVTGPKNYVFTSFLEKDGLPNNSIYGIQQDSHNNLWLSTNKGLSKFNTESGTFRNYFESDGLRNDQFFWGAHMKLSTGEMIFGGINGFNIFYPDSIHVNSFKPKVHITDFQIFNKRVKVAEELEGQIVMNKPICEAEKINLSYKHKVFSLKFASLDYINPGNNKYAYRMLGFESEWNYVENRRFVSYTNLSPGSYTFEVKATNSDGIWNEEPTKLKIQIYPPFWKTTWFILLEIIVFILVFLAIIRLRERNLLREKRSLNEKVSIRTKAIEQQKEEINAQKEEIENQRDVVIQQKQEITDSIIYAKRIQSAILPPDELITKNLTEHFILFIPRDIVSGDFYWIKKINKYLLIAAADCTGHGVPGAFMSMLGITLLNEIVRYKEITKANQMLNELRKQVKVALHQAGKEGEAEDGIDMALCVIDFENMKMQFAGARNSLYLIRNEKLTEIKGDKMPIGIYMDEKESFTNHEINIEKNDCFYLFTDGYIDQFGSDEDKKFTSSRFKKLLSEIHQKSLSEQNEILKKTLEHWKTNRKQVDDITVIGFKL